MLAVVMPEFNTEKIAISIAVLLAVAAEFIVMAIVNAKYRKKHSVNLIWGGIAMFFAVALLGLGIGLLVEKNLLGITALLVFLIITGVVAYFDIKKLGLNEGVKALIIQTLLCIGALCDVGDFVEKFRKRREAKNNNQQNEYLNSRYNFNYYINNGIQNTKEDETITEYDNQNGEDEGSL